jgi:Tfp pilus assembly protein PilZ
MRDVASQFREYVRLDRIRRSGALTPAELHRFQLLKRKLGQHFSPGLSSELADARDSVRIPTRLAVNFVSEGELGRCLMTTLSKRGLFVGTAHLLEIGTRLELHVQVDQPPRIIQLPAEVVSHGVGPSFRLERGMGLRFLDLSPEAEKALDDLYERLVT